MYSAKFEIPGARILLYRGTATCDNQYLFDYPDGGGQCFCAGDGLGWTSFKVYLGEATLCTTVAGPSGQTTSVQPGLTTTPMYPNSTSSYTPILTLTSTGSPSGLSSGLIGGMVGLALLALSCIVALGFWVIKLRKFKKRYQFRRERRLPFEIGGFEGDRESYEAYRLRERTSIPEGGRLGGE